MIATAVLMNIKLFQGIFIRGHRNKAQSSSRNLRQSVQLGQIYKIWYYCIDLVRIFEKMHARKRH